MAEHVYIDQGGRIACRDHGGAYLQAAIDANPNRKQITTPTDTWIRFELAVLEAEGLPGCEVCGPAPADHELADNLCP